MRTSLIALLAGSLLATSAAATDLYGRKDVQSDYPQAEFLPKGFYASIGIGGSLLQGKAANATDSVDLGFGGFMGDARIGYDFKMGNSPYVIGMLAGVSFKNIKADTVSGQVATGTEVFGYELGARFGRTFNGTSLGYVLVAYEGQHIGLQNTGFTDDLKGIKVGGGLEVDLTNSLFFGPEVDYVWYDTLKAKSQTLDQDELVAKLVIGKRF